MEGDKVDEIILEKNSNEENKTEEPNVNESIDKETTTETPINKAVNIDNEATTEAPVNEEKDLIENSSEPTDNTAKPDTNILEENQLKDKEPDTNILEENQLKDKEPDTNILEENQPKDKERDTNILEESQLKLKDKEPDTNISEESQPKDKELSEAEDDEEMPLEDKLQDIATVSVDDIPTDQNEQNEDEEGEAADPIASREDPIESTDELNKDESTDPINTEMEQEPIEEDRMDTSESVDCINDGRLLVADEKSMDAVSDTNSDSISLDNNLDTSLSSETNSNFIDASTTADNTTALIDDDPIGGDDEEETILAVDQEKSDKYIITHANKSDTCKCTICEKEQVPKYLAQKNEDILYVCSNDCLPLFKERYTNNFVERILRLRSFANQDKEKEKENMTLIGENSDDEANEEFEYEVDKDPPINNSLRKCKSCNCFIDLDNYISWEAEDFCNEGCLLVYEKSITSDCAKCKKHVQEEIMGKFCVRFGNTITQFCSTACLLSYKKSYKFCAYCQEDMRGSKGEKSNFCSKRCMEVCGNEQSPAEIIVCAVCHQSKKMEIKVRTSSKEDALCSEPCFVAYKFVNQIELTKCESCPVYFVPQPDDPIIYSGEEAHRVCSKDCQKIYLITYRKIVICNNCSVKKYDFDMIKLCEKNMSDSFACSNLCLQGFLEKTYQETILNKTAPNVKQLENIAKEGDFMHEGKSLMDIIKMANLESKIPVEKIIIERPILPKKLKNVASLCKPTTCVKSTSKRYREASKDTQTDKLSNSVVVPVPVPIFVPVPLHMFVEHVPMVFPVPLPLPVPIFIPTGRKSANGIMKEIQKIKNRVPADPLEAELLMMAEMAAGDKKDESSDSDQEEPPKPTPVSTTFPVEETAPSFGEDMLQMALKMATDFEEPVDLEGVVVPSTISSMSGPENPMDAKRKCVKVKKSMKRHEMLSQPHMNLEIEKSDANSCLKFTFGVNAWKQWVAMKNIELQKTQKKPKLFKQEILQLTADDLNFSLCLFVKEVRKPNGTEYAPDTIYYLCLGIQQYLYENGRIDNIFCDSFYEKFTDTFNDVCQKFAKLYNDAQYIVTRVEEEHLWESKQLGAHSPLVLLNTLMFFNTKHFSLTTVDEHLQLSFSHIMKHWKRNPNLPGARNVLLRFYPPQSTDTGKRKKVYEQQENDENPLRCPVKLYEFYLSKCPESVKTRNDVFYLQPERSCVPDSPVWYSTIALAREPLEKMLHRVKMVKEINIALLGS